METIYYCYEKLTGLYAGSGTPYIDKDFYSSTDVPAPPHGAGQYCLWNGDLGEWEVSNTAPSTDPQPTPETIESELTSEEEA